MFRLLAASDWHLGAPSSRAYQAKLELVEAALHQDFDYFIVAGDITHTGSENRRQLGQLLADVGSRPNVIIGPGNHDETRDSATQPVLAYLYSRVLREELPFGRYRESLYDPETFCFHLYDPRGLSLICLGKYPTPAARLWLRGVLKVAAPALVIFFHYPINSKRVPPETFIELGAILLPYKSRVLCLITGHEHQASPECETPGLLESEHLEEPEVRWLKYGPEGFVPVSRVEADFLNVPSGHYDSYAEIEIEGSTITHLHIRGL